MAHPKQKQSKARTAKRKANWKLTAPNVTQCSHCHQSVRPHRVCGNCGWYDGRQAVAVDTQA